MNAVTVENIPADMIATDQWLCWDSFHEPGKSKPRKVPKSSRCKGGADKTNPAHFMPFDEAMQTYRVRAYDGVGIALADSDPYTAIDIDECIDAEGKLSEHARKLVELFDSYTETSPSGEGIRIIARGKFTGKNRTKPANPEMYCRAHYVTITGNHLAGTPTTIENRQAQIYQLYAQTAKPKSERNMTGAGVDVAKFDQAKLLERAWRYIAKCPDAISGNGGHNATFRAACECYRFGLDDEHAGAAMDRFNAEKTGGEAWDADALQHKLISAREEVEEAGEIGSRLKSRLVDRKNPGAIAKRIIAELYHHVEHPTLTYTDDDFYRFNGSHYEVKPTTAVRKQVRGFLEPLDVAIQRGEQMQIEEFKPCIKDINEVASALSEIAYAPVRAPQWMGPIGPNDTDPTKLIVARNGIFSIDGAELVKVCDPTPRLFTTYALDYDLRADAPPPRDWLAFMDDIFDNDTQQIELLQEWAGYIATSDTSQQKIALMIGPPRSGKGTVARILTQMIGPSHVAAPTLAGLATNFGLSALLGKSLAVISDARLSGRTDQAIVVERMLTISGEDGITIDRKNRDPLTTVKLPTRLMVMTNELPKLADASGALANRFLILSLKKSYLGCEDVGLTERLTRELPGIARWAIDGLMRLRAEGRFTTPAAANAIRDELNDLASPIGAFLRDWCKVQPGASSTVDDLFIAWGLWSADQGRKDAGTRQTFGRDLRAAVPGVLVRQPRTDDGRVRAYEGIGLTLTAQALVDVERARKAEPEHRREHAYV